jgi:hypothetical protein
MRIEINIGNRQALAIILAIIAVSAIGLAAAYQTTYTPDLMGHSWGEIECQGCITNTNLAGNSVTGAKIQDGSITNADISSSAAIDGSKITGTVPNAQKIGGVGIGSSLYSMPAGCGGALTTSTTCSTIQCGGGLGYYYYKCDGTCSYSYTTPQTCSTTLVGKILASN